MARHEATYWSSCCGALAEYAGYYRCRRCGQALHIGRAREPHLLSVRPAEPAKAETITTQEGPQ